MYVQYKVNVSENQVDTLKDVIRLKKCVTLCFPTFTVERWITILLVGVLEN